MKLEPGAQVNDRITLVERLEGGAMGSVWIADHAGLGTQVVVKFLDLGDLPSQDQSVKRFAIEARAAASVKSPHVVQMFDYGLTDDDTPFIVMERLAGEPLQAKLKREGRLSLAETVPIISQACRALTVAHELGVIHRDIKPGNIFLTVAHDELIVKVLDFGMAKQSLERDGSRITDPGVVVGTPAYFSREVLTSGSHAADAQADLWALAVVAYRCLSGELPFRGANVTEICRAILRRSFPKPSELEPSLSAEVDAWFDRAFAEDVSARFADARELGTTFSALAETPPESADVVAPPASEPAPGIGPAPYLAIGAIGVVAIVVYAGDALWTPPPMPAALDTPPPPTATATSSASATPAPAPPPALPPLKTADPAGARSEHDEILVPGGDVWAGCHDGDLACEPRDPQRVQPFYLTRHEITVFAYAACVTAGACSDRDLQLADDGTHPRAPTGQCAWRQPAHESHPLNCVSYAQAESYCRFIGARLPTENEWLLAARGPDHRRYPWGDEAASCARAVMQDDRGRACGERGSHVAGSWPEDVSPSGALDLGGNVREWTASWLDDGQTRRVIKGGSWLDDDPQALRIGTRHALAPAETSVRVGFRCARSPE